MRVKGSENPQAKREEVVVAYGAGRFPSSMKGMCAVPVRKFLKQLRRYVTVVLVDEFRTSRVCSKCWEKQWQEGGSDSDLVKEVEEQAESAIVLEAREKDEDRFGHLERAEEEAIRER